MVGGMGRRGGGRARPADDVGVRHFPWRVLVLCAACVVVVGVAGLARSLAQDAEPDATAAPPSHAKKVDHRRRHPAPARKAEAPAAAAPKSAGPVAPAPAQPASTGPPEPGAAAPTIFDAQLLKAGVTTCAERVSRMAALSMHGVTSVATASNWYAATPDKRPVTLLLGQKYGETGVPFGATGVIATPQPDGKCDAVSVQVVPSPLPCAQLRDNLAKSGKQVADLAGVALMQDATGQTMLVPTGAGACVLVGVRGAYAK